MQKDDVFIPGIEPGTLSGNRGELDLCIHIM